MLILHLEEVINKLFLLDKHPDKLKLNIESHHLELFRTILAKVGTTEASPRNTYDLMSSVFLKTTIGFSASTNKLPALQATWRRTNQGLYSNTLESPPISLSGHFFF